MADLLEQFGQIDIHLFDQILRGRIAAGMRVLDAGCGGGRNLVYFLLEGYEVYGADAEKPRRPGVDWYLPIVVVGLWACKR